MSKPRNSWHPAEQLREQLGRRTDEQYNKLRNVFGVTYRNISSDDHGDSDLRVFGTTALVVLSYHNSEHGRVMPLRAFLPVMHEPGVIEYKPTALHSDGLQCYDAMLPVSADDPDPCNPSLPSRRRQFLGWVARFDSDVEYGARQDARLPARIILPQVYLAFAPEDLPEFHMTAALRRFAANELRRGTAFSDELVQRKLDNPDRIGQMALENYFRDQFLYPGEKAGPGAVEPGLVNDTEHVLMHASFCFGMGQEKVVAAFESVRGIRGRETYNPVSRVIREAAEAAGFDASSNTFEKPLRLRVPNPAREVFATLGFNLPANRDTGFNQFTEEQIEEVVFTMTQAIGLRGGQISAYRRDDVYDAILHPDSPAMAISEIIARSRRRLPPHLRALVREEDYRAAVFGQHRPVRVANAYTVQTCRMQKLPPEDAFSLAQLCLPGAACGNLWVQPGASDPLALNVMTDVEAEASDVEELPPIVDDTLAAGLATEI